MVGITPPTEAYDSSEGGPDAGYEDDVLVEMLDPITESVVSLPGGRCLGYAEFGDPDGDVVLWFHGTPGARKQLPPEAPALALAQGFRIIGVERPGTGYSTPYGYGRVLDWADDVRRFADGLGVDRFATVGLSGGGPFVLAACYALPERVVAGAVLGGIGPTRGTDAPLSYTRLLPIVEPLITAGRVVIGEVLTHAIRPVRALGSQAYDLYTNVAPPSDRPAMRRPGMKEMFMADILTACEGGLRAPVSDLVLFGRHWGFSIADIEVPICFWHGDADGIVPLSHGERQHELVRGSELIITPGGGHFAGFVVGADVLAYIDRCWSDREHRPAHTGPHRPASSGAPRASTDRTTTPQEHR